MFENTYPGIMSVLDHQHAKVWFDIIARWQANREVQEKLSEMDQKGRKTPGPIRPAVPIA
jgi:hypothetical protein